MTTEDDIREVRARITQAQTAVTRAQLQRDNVRAKVADATKVVKDEFGVGTVADAKALLAQLKEQLDQAVQEAQEQLNEAGA